MSASEIFTALEQGVITQSEAVEQAMVDNVDQLYARVRREEDRRTRRRAA